MFEILPILRKVREQVREHGYYQPRNHHVNDWVSSPQMRQRATRFLGLDSAHSEEANLDLRELECALQILHSCP